MAITDTLVLDDPTGTDCTFDLINRSGYQSRRLDRASTLVEPRELFISHTTSVDKDAITTDRHLVSFRKVLVNSKGVPVQAQVNLTMPIPRDIIVSESVVLGLVANLIDFITDGAMTTWTTQSNVKDILKNAS